MAASALIGEALGLGLASGPACVASCGPVLVPTLLTGKGGVRPNALVLMVFLGARLFGYLVFAAAAWEVGALAHLVAGTAHGADRRGECDPGRRAALVRL